MTSFLNLLTAARLSRPGRARIAASVLMATTNLLVSAQSHAQSESDSEVGRRRSELRLGYERIDLPGSERVGLIGTTYLLDLGYGFAVGPAVYGAIDGHRGGLFTLGAELAWKTRLTGPLEFQAGYYAGGGGGSAAPVGGGLMVRPHADLLWNFGRFKAGITASQVRFPNGSIASRQFGLVLSADTDFSFIRQQSDGSLPSALGASGIGFDRIVAVGGTYFPAGGTLRLSGAPLSSHVRYVGARLERMFIRDGGGQGAFGLVPYWGVEAAGAAGGGVAGFAEYLGTLGVEASPWGAGSTIGGRVAAGMAGGGDVSVGGGLLLKGSVYASVRLTRDVGLGLEAGYAKAPEGSFRAPFASVNVNWTLDTPGSAPLMPTGPAVRTEWIAGVGTYRAARNDGTTRSLQNVVLKGNRFLADNWYVTAQAHSGYSGGAGGYTVGLVGAGYESPQWARMRVSAEMLVGAAGGGGVATGGGALVQPMAYLSYRLNDSLSARVGVGRIRSNSGQLSSNVAEASIVFPFGVSPRP